MATSYLKEKTVETNLIDWKKLQTDGRFLETPFQLIFEETGETLTCEEIIRIVPGKRLVAFSTWKEQLVVAKLFYDPSKAKTHSEREVEGIDALLMSNIPTPNLLFQGTTLQGRVHVLIFERILNSINLDEGWNQPGLRSQLTPYMHALVYELATQHVHGIIQHDFHLKNFLIRNLTPPPFDETNTMDWLLENQIFLLDGANIDKHEGVLPKEKSLEHLALFFAQLDVNTEELQKELFQLYSHARGWALTKTDIEIFRKAKKNCLYKRWKRYEKKIMRDCTLFAKFSTYSSEMMIDRQYLNKELIQFLKNPDNLFSHSETTILKDGNSATVAKVYILDKFYILKRYNIKSSWHGVKRMLRDTRAAHSWKLGQLIRLFGIPTAKPIAFIEKRIFGLRGTSYLLTEYIDAPHIGDYFCHCNPEQIQQTVKNLMVILTNLAKLRVTHGDLKMTNILITKEGPVLIDLDGMVYHHSNFTLEHSFRKEFQRLLDNWEHQPIIKTAFDQI